MVIAVPRLTPTLALTWALAAAETAVSARTPPTTSARNSWFHDRFLQGGAARRMSTARPGASSNDFIASWSSLLPGRGGQIPRQLPSSDRRGIEAYSGEDFGGVLDAIRVGLDRRHTWSSPRSPLRLLHAFRSPDRVGWRCLSSLRYRGHWDSSAVILSFPCRSAMCFSTSALRSAGGFIVDFVDASVVCRAPAVEPDDCAYAPPARNVDGEVAVRHCLHGDLPGNGRWPELACIRPGNRGNQEGAPTLGVCASLNCNFCTLHRTHPHGCSPYASFRAARAFPGS